VELAIKEGKTRVIDIDLRAYFDNVRHHILLTKLAQRIDDPDVMHVREGERARVEYARFARRPCAATARKGGRR